jgi:hypothetical protein
MKFLFLIFLTGCSWSNFQYQYVDVSAAEYVNRFEKACLIYPAVSIVLADFEPGYFGHCANYGTNSSLNVVSLNKDFWATATDIQKEILVFHELGHCVLNRRHDDRLKQLGSYINAPASLMYSMPYGYEIVFKEFRTYYLNELCGARI